MSSATHFVLLALLACCIACHGDSPRRESDASSDDAATEGSHDTDKNQGPAAEPKAGAGLDGLSSSPSKPSDNTDAEPGDASYVAVNPLLPRADNVTCKIPDTGPLGEYSLRDAFPALTFNRPLWVGTAPGDANTMYVVEQSGVIYVFDKRTDVQPEERTTFDERTVLREGNEEGLLGLAFHPQYAENGRLFIYYSTAVGCPDDGPRCGVLSELARSTTDPRVVEPTSERNLLLIPQPFPNHNGGGLGFGPDGYLYFSLGDGGTGGDPLRHGQNKSTLLGTISRIDVDRRDAGKQYGIPTDNPFASDAAGASEIWAFGLRNPWRFSFDRSTGLLWAGDVGQGCFEEVNRMAGPGNYGWNVREGVGCYSGDACSKDASACPGDFIDPLWQYGRDEGKSITGGVVYRGSALPALWGAYLFADYASRTVWALRERDGQEPEVVVVAQSPGSPASFGEDADGEVYIASFDGKIYALSAAETAPTGAMVPEKLSATGCFTELSGLTPAPGVLPYEINQPFWSDGADKQRFFALPDGATAAMREDGSFDYPAGTVFIKSFSLTPQGQDVARKIETRLYVKHAHGFRGFTYRWNDEQTEAFLLAGQEDQVFAGPHGEQTWTYPSRAQCDQCHTSAAGHVLGFNAAQLDREMLYGAARVRSQLATLEEAGYIARSAAAQQKYPALDDPNATLEARARAYLAVNCAMCHQPQGPGNARLDLRAQTALSAMGACNEAPGQGDMGINDALLIAPGAAERSVLLARMATRGQAQMPPLASHVVDEAGISLLTDWIAALSDCAP